MSEAGRRVGLGMVGRGEVRDMVRYALEAERAGLESIWIHDTYFERDPITYLGAVGAAVGTLRLGAGAVNPLTRHPVVLAMTGSALDDLVPGRFSMALGSGLPLRLAQMNIPHGDTVAEVSRAIDLLRTMWAGERVSLNPEVPPIQPMFQAPHRIPLYIAGYQRRFLDLCGKKADGYLARPAESLPAFRLMRQRIARVAEQSGRNPEEIECRGYLLTLIGTTRREALNRAKREPFVIYMMSVLSNVSLQRAGLPPALRDAIAAAWRAEEYHRAAELIPDALLDAFLACGTVEEVAQKALAYHEAGMDVPLLQPILQEDEQVEAVLAAARLYASDGRLAAGSEVAEVGTAPVLTEARGRHRLSRHLQAAYEIARPFSLTAAAIPILAGGALAFAGQHFTFWLFLLALIGGVMLQVGTNVINEIYDVRQGIDKITSPRASQALLKGMLTEREAFIFAFGAFAITALIGLVLIAARGWPMALLGVLGLIAGYSYTGPPFQYKFHGLGVPLVFFLMGPLMVEGSYYAAAGAFSATALYASIPVGLLVAAILHANEWRDISEDARADVTTLSSELGARLAHRVYLALVIGAYLVVGVAALGHLLPLSAVLVILSLPVLIPALRASELGASGQVRALAMIDLSTARLHLYFGLLLATGLLLARYLH